MQFALVNGERAIPTKGLSGSCPACESSMIAKCGEVRVDHWAHRGERKCDRWWEPETQWHRDWKNRFAPEFQEVVMPDKQTGEKHIADVRTSHELVIEFQHSHLDSTERISREQFYGNMVWVVDGARLKRDLPRFLEGRTSFRRLGQGIFITSFPQESFPKTWLECGAPVFFDFNDEPNILDTITRNGPLYCLLPIRVHEKAVIIALERQDFIRLAGLGSHIFSTGIVKEIADFLLTEERALFAAEQARMLNYRRKVAFSMARRRYRSKPPSW